MKKTFEITWQDAPEITAEKLERLLAFWQRVAIIDKPYTVKEIDLKMKLNELCDRVTERKVAPYIREYYINQVLSKTKEVNDEITRQNP